MIKTQTAWARSWVSSPALAKADHNELPCYTEDSNETGEQTTCAAGEAGIAIMGSSIEGPQKVKNKTTYNEVIYF